MKPDSGALAGPVAVGAVILSNKPRLSSTLSGVRDSKQMTPLARERLAPRIKSPRWHGVWDSHHRMKLILSELSLQHG